MLFHRKTDLFETRRAEVVENQSQPLCAKNYARYKRNRSYKQP